MIPTFVSYAQTRTIDEALEYAAACKRISLYHLLDELDTERKRWKVRAYAFLNRACELDCIPLHLCPVETAQGIEMAWYTYRPVAEYHIGDAYFTDGTRIPKRVSSSIPDAAVIVGYESELIETEARSRAIGW